MDEKLIGLKKRLLLISVSKNAINLQKRRLQYHV